MYEFPIVKDCINEQTFCRVSFSYNLSPEFRGGEWYIKFDKPLKRINFTKKNSEVIVVNDINSCLNKLNLGYTFRNKTFEIENSVPIFSITFFIFLLLFGFQKNFYNF